MTNPTSQRETLWTVGHSTRSQDAFFELLNENRIGVVADVRRFPGSRRFPQFSKDALAASLAAAGVEYLPVPELGGRRRPTINSPNTGWNNEGFRGYADYMATNEFKAGIQVLLEAAKRKRVALMCAEALWWRCHRSLISDFLKSQGYCVLHMMGPGKVQEHPYTSPARIVGTHLCYPPVPSNPPKQKPLKRR